MLFIYSALPLKICSLFRKTIICVMIFTSATLILFGRASCDQILIWLWFIQKCQSQVCTSDDFLLHMSCQIISECYGNLFINFLRLYVRFGSPFCLLLLWLCQVHLRKIFSEGKKQGERSSLMKKESKCESFLWGKSPEEKNTFTISTTLFPVSGSSNFTLRIQIMSKIKRNKDCDF